jgi:hypothetical protein
MRGYGYAMPIHFAPFCAASFLPLNKQILSFSAIQKYKFLLYNSESLLNKPKSLYRYYIEWFLFVHHIFTSKELKMRNSGFSVGDSVIPEILLIPGR